MPLAVAHRQRGFDRRFHAKQSGMLAKGLQTYSEVTEQLPIKERREPVLLEQNGVVGQGTARHFFVGHAQQRTRASGQA